MNRSLKDLLVIVKELLTVYGDYKKAAADGRISAEEGLTLAGGLLAILNNHNVTLVELQDLLGEVGPMLALARK